MQWTFSSQFDCLELLSLPVMASVTNSQLCLYLMEQNNNLAFKENEHLLVSIKSRTEDHPNICR